MSETDDAEVTCGVSLPFIYGCQSLGPTFRFYKVKNGRIFGCALLSLPWCRGLEKQKIPFNFASGLLIPLSLMEDPKIAPLIGGWPVFKT